MASWGWGRCDGGGKQGGTAAGRSRRKLVEGSTVQTFHFRCFQWLLCLKPFPWRCRSPDRWPLCRFCSCNQRIVSSTKTKRNQNKVEDSSSSAFVWLCSKFARLTFDFQIHSACRPGSVLQRKMTSTSGQNLAWGVLRRKYIYKGLILIQGDFSFSPCQFSYLDGVEWPLLCTQNCHKNCYWSWTRGALEQRYGTSALNDKL